MRSSRLQKQDNGPRRWHPAAAEGAEEDEVDSEEMETGDADQKNETEADQQGPPLPEAGDTPNDTLFCPALPDDVTDESLGAIFQE